MSERSETTTKVVVLGGGYAGTMAANHLRLSDDVAITLVNPRPRFVERIRLHQLVAGTHEATAGYDTLLGEGIELVVDTATRIDTDDRTVALGSGRVLSYDFLIYAVGFKSGRRARRARRDATAPPTGFEPALPA